jgi:hypothetical protein
VLESADWHGTAVPSRWTGDGVIGLLLSLATQGRRELAETLTREILLRLPLVQCLVTSKAEGYLRYLTLSRGLLSIRSIEWRNCCPGLLQKYSC